MKMKSENKTIESGSIDQIQIVSKDTDTPISSRMYVKKDPLTDTVRHLQLQGLDVNRIAANLMIPVQRVKHILKK